MSVGWEGSNLKGQINLFYCAAAIDFIKHCTSFITKHNMARKEQHTPKKQAL